MKTFSRHVVKFGGFFCAAPVMAVYFGFKGLSDKNGPSGHPPGEMPLNRKIAKNYFFWQKIEK